MYKIDIPKKPLLVVEGNIGAGKSTFLRLIEAELNAQFVYEPLHEWQNVSGENFLDYFYKDTARWSYAFQTYAFLTRVRAQEKCARSNSQPLQVLERSVYSDRYCFTKTCFERGLMKPLEWELYQEWFEWLVEQYTPKPDAFIYLRADPKICFQRLLKRNRSEESGVSLDYLELIHEKHEDWLIHKKKISPLLAQVPVLVLACDEDFEHNSSIWGSHVRAVIEFLEIHCNLPADMTVSSTATI